MAETRRGKTREPSSPRESSSSRTARRRRMEIRRFKFVTGDASPENSSILPEEVGNKRKKLEVCTASFSRECENAVENCVGGSSSEEEGEVVVVEEKEIVVKVDETGKPEAGGIVISRDSSNFPLSPSLLLRTSRVVEIYPKYGIVSVCGRRRDMEDAVAVHPSFCRKEHETAPEFHYFGVYDGHGCSHVATRCRERLHELVKEELQNKESSASASAILMEWKGAMERSFCRMDKEVIAWNEGRVGANCRCELQTPECDAVGSTAVVAIVTPDKIIVANCGDSRAVLCRNGKPVPLSSDHKPDRPDELSRIQEAGGRIIYWDGPRVLGVLAMSRAIGDNYLKPFVSCEPEVTVTERTAEDECLILASDGLWDVVSNDTACGVARMCLRGKAGKFASPENAAGVGGGEMSDEACSDASMLLTKLALARHSTDNVSVVVVDLRSETRSRSS